MHSRGLHIRNQSHSVQLTLSSQVAPHVAIAHSLSIMTSVAPETMATGLYKISLTRWYTPTCPNSDECSVANWAETDQCRSYDSEYKCRVKIYEHLKSDCHGNQSYQDGLLWRWAETAQVAKVTDCGLWFPDDLQKPEHEEIAVYHMKYNGPFAPKKKATSSSIQR